MSLTRPPRASSAPIAKGGIQLTPSTTIRGIYAAYMWNNVAISLWFAAPAFEDIAAFEQGCRERIARCPEGLSGIHILVPGSNEMPSPETRDELARILREYSQQSAAVVVVIPGNGFWTGSLRGLVTTLSVLADSAVKPQICSNYDEVCEWLPAIHRARTGVELDPKELLEALKQAEREAALQAVA
jgi:hypothetical protein